jgi:hypothetical protein
MHVWIVPQPRPKSESTAIANALRKARARGCRLPAEELRVISEDVILRETQQTLRGLAETYEQLAATLDAAIAP